MKMQVDIPLDDGVPLGDAPEMVVVNPGAPRGTIQQISHRPPAEAMCRSSLMTPAL